MTPTPEYRTNRPELTVEERAEDITSWDTNIAPDEAMDCAIKHLNEVAAAAYRRGQEEMRARCVAVAKEQMRYAESRVNELKAMGCHKDAAHWEPHAAGCEIVKGRIAALPLNPVPETSD